MKDGKMSSREIESIRELVVLAKMASEALSSGHLDAAVTMQRMLVTGLSGIIERASLNPLAITPRLEFLHVGKIDAI